MLAPMHHAGARGTILRIGCAVWIAGCASDPPAGAPDVVDSDLDAITSDANASDANAHDASANDTGHDATVDAPAPDTTATDASTADTDTDDAPATDAGPGVCRFSPHEAPGACLSVGGFCSLDAECCDGVCVGGRCGAADAGGTACGPRHCAVGETCWEATCGVCASADLYPLGPCTADRGCACQLPAHEACSGSFTAYAGVGGGCECGLSCVGTLAGPRYCEKRCTTSTECGAGECCSSDGFEASVCRAVADLTAGACIGEVSCSSASDCPYAECCVPQDGGTKRCVAHEIVGDAGACNL